MYYYNTYSENSSYCGSQLHEAGWERRKTCRSYSSWRVLLAYNELRSIVLLSYQHQWWKWRARQFLNTCYSTYRKGQISILTLERRLRPCLSSRRADQLNKPQIRWTKTWKVTSSAKSCDTLIPPGPAVIDKYAYIHAQCSWKHVNESRTGRKSGVTWNMWRTERTTIQIQIQANADEEYFVTLSSPSANWRAVWVMPASSFSIISVLLKPQHCILISHVFWYRLSSRIILIRVTARNEASEAHRVFSRVGAEFPKGTLRF